MSALFNVPESAIKSSASLSSSVHFGEYDEIGGKFKTEVVLEGQSVVYVNRVEEVCCGAVGSAGRKQPEQQLENASAKSGEMQMAVGGAYLSFFAVGSSQKTGQMVEEFRHDSCTVMMIAVRPTQMG